MQQSLERNRNGTLAKVIGKIPWKFRYITNNTIVVQDNETVSELWNVKIKEQAI